MQLAELEHQTAKERMEDRKIRERAKLEAYRRARQHQLDELKSKVCHWRLDDQSGCFHQMVCAMVPIMNMKPNGFN